MHIFLNKHLNIASVTCSFSPWLLRVEVFDSTIPEPDHQSMFTHHYQYHVRQPRLKLFFFFSGMKWEDPGWHQGNVWEKKHLIFFDTNFSRGLEQRNCMTLLVFFCWTQKTWGFLPKEWVHTKTARLLGSTYFKWTIHHKCQDVFPIGRRQISHCVIWSFFFPTYSMKLGKWQVCNTKGQWQNSMCVCLEYKLLTLSKSTPRKTNLSPKRAYFNRKYIFQPLIFRGHVSFPGSKFESFPLLFNSFSRDAGNFPGNDRMAI